MPKPFPFELVSPEKLVFSGEVEQVDIPGADGDFGVLAEHSPLISTIRPGVIQIHQGGRVVHRIFIAGGFAEVTPERCTVLADATMAVSDIDRTAAQNDYNLLNNESPTATDEQHKAQHARSLAIAKARVAAAEAGR